MFQVELRRVLDVDALVHEAFNELCKRSATEHQQESRMTSTTAGIAGKGRLETRKSELLIAVR